VLVFYNCVYIPVELFFLNGIVVHGDYPKHPVHVAIDFFVDFLFLVDILLNMCTSYYNEDYEMVLDRRQIIRHYARFWLWIDGLAFFPFEVPFLILQSSGTLTEASFPTGVFGMLKLPRLFRLARVFKKLDVVAAGNWFRILGIMIFFSLIAHWVACIWWAIGWAEFMDDRNEQRTSNSASFIMRHGVSWLSRVPGESLTNSSRFEHQYLSSMYWSLTTLMKTPWVGPDTVGEKMFASAAVVMGAILFAALLGNVTALVQTYDKFNAQKRNKITLLNNFNTSRKVPSTLQQKLFDYVDAEWTITAGLDDGSILAQLPGQLRGDVIAAIYKETLLKSPLFSCCSLACAKALLLRLQPEICLQKQVLISRDSLCQEVYVLMRGGIQVASGGGSKGGSKGGSNNGRHRKMAGEKERRVEAMFRLIEKPGSVIGHIDPFQREVKRYPFLVTAVRQTHLVSLSRVDVLEVLPNFEMKDGENVLRVLNEEHAKTVDSLTSDKRDAPVDNDAAERAKNESIRSGSNTLHSLRARVDVLEEKLLQCVDDMRAAREATDTLPELLRLVNAVNAKVNAGKQPRTSLNAINAKANAGKQLSFRLDTSAAACRSAAKQQYRSS